MSSPTQSPKRMYFGKIEEIIEPPSLIEIQLKSFDEFIQAETPPDKREFKGLEAVLREIFPIESYDGKIKLHYIHYEVAEPKMSALEALRSGETYSIPLYVVFDLTDEAGTKRERVYLGEMPNMTERGTFIINGAERVVISQLHRSPGVCFESSVHLSGVLLHGFRIIPDRGTWLEIQFDTNGLLYVYLDRRMRRRKFLATTFLRAIGFSTNEEIIKEFYEIIELDLNKDYDDEYLHNKLIIDDINDGDSIVAKAYDALTIGLVKQIKSQGTNKIKCIEIAEDDILVKSLKKDASKNPDEALKIIYQTIRPGDPPTSANAKSLVKRLFFDEKRYDLTNVGRYKLNQKLKLDIDSECRILQKEDVISAMKYLLKLKRGEGLIDDIDHLGSRRVRTVGELVSNQCRVGLARTGRLIKERMTLYDINTNAMTPQKLVNPKALTAVIKDFFGRSQLSQFMDQTNPLSELTHKRRLSALGPGGLNRERAGFEVRDVHSSHYGRICPIETPEGPNIGLINSISCYAKINKFGFIETPYRKIIKGKASNEIVYLTADQEENCMIAQANNLYDKNGIFLNKLITVRLQGEFIEVEPEKCQYMDVSPKQLISVAASLIPFLEHDDANRALMGSNMQRQSVPLIESESPLVGTGMEYKVARSAKAVILSKSDGIVASSTADRVIITKDGKLPVSETDLLNNKDSVKTDKKNDTYVYHLRKFMRSNSGTTINEIPLVKRGDKVKKGDVIADGPNTDKGDLALGKNLLVAFIPWNGYNFEDAITISERVVKEDVFTSIHSSEFEVEARDTKLGPEEITRDIPSLSEEMLKNLDENGVIRLGAEVKPGDILVGKITPKSETELAPEERLLRAIFGEKAADVKDTSLRVPSGCAGTIMEVRITSRPNVEGEKPSEDDLNQQRKDLIEDHKIQRDELLDTLTQQLANIFLGEKISLDIDNALTGETIVAAGTKVTKTLLRKVAQNFDNLEIDESPLKEKIDTIVKNFIPKFNEIDIERDKQLDRIERGDSLKTITIKSVKIFVASKRKLSVGDKMAGRHGNKGVVATIVPEEDMPFLEDGTPVDICLNPLGVPSRMNVGQILETHLGIAAKALNMKIETPVFDGISEKKIMEYLKQAKKVDGFSWIGENGKSYLYDGFTGKRFHQKVVVGYIYMLKLGHLVADKIHSRAVGPYSLVTQQPLGGKAQYGGQRFGEMEVWALEAYGAAYTLQELLTVKSDDVKGRTRIYESIVKGDNTLEAGTPESFNVLIKEMQSLGLNVKLQSKDAYDQNKEEILDLEALIK